MVEKDISPKSTKSELFVAYSELLNKVQTQKNIEPKLVKEVLEKKEIVKVASETNQDSIVKNIAELKLHIIKSLDNIEELTTKEYKKLIQIQEACKIESKNLEELYQIKANADSLNALLLAQKDKKQLFDEDISQRKTQWIKDQEDYEKNLKETETLQKKQRDRNEEEYTYTLKLTRKKEQDAYNEKSAKLEKELEEKRYAFEDEFSIREQNIISKEQMLAELNLKVENFPTELEKTIKLTEKNITEKLQSQNNFEKQLLSKDTESDKKLKEQIISSLELKIKEQEKLIAELTKKADTSSNQVKEIAVKALESTSNMRYPIKERKEDSNT